MQAQNLEEAVRNKRFLEAEDIVNANKNVLKDIQDFNKGNLFDNIVRDKAFNVLDALIENNCLGLDIYEYDDFKNTIFKSFIHHLPNDDESMAYFGGFIEQVDSLNDSLQDDSWLSFALKSRAKAHIIKIMVKNGCSIDKR